MNENIQELGFFDVIKARRSVRIFDQKSQFDHQVVQKCLEASTLAPNSSNLQLWEFYRIPETSPLKKTLDQLCMRQKAASTARELVVVVTRRDKWKIRTKANQEYIKETYKNSPESKQKKALAYYGKLIPRLYSKYPLWSFLKQLIAWFVGLKRPMIREVSETDIRVSVHKSAALAGMTFMYAMKAEGYDTCPMEGMDSLRVKKLLNLPKCAEISMIIGCGKGLPEGIYGKRFRVPNTVTIFKM